MGQISKNLFLLPSTLLLTHAELPMEGALCVQIFQSVLQVTDIISSDLLVIRRSVCSLLLKYLST